MLHHFNNIVDLVQSHVVSDEFIQHHLLVEVGLHHVGHTVPTLKS